MVFGGLDWRNPRKTWWDHVVLIWAPETPWVSSYDDFCVDFLNLSTLFINFAFQKLVSCAFLWVQDPRDRFLGVLKPPYPDP